MLNITITVNEKGQLAISGFPADIIMTLGILEACKDIVKQWAKTEAEKKVQIAEKLPGPYRIQ